MTNIIVTTFNRLEYTKQCLQSVFDNTDKSDYHLTVIDNNSTDGTKEYLTELKANDKIDTLHLLNENVGVACAVNLGIDVNAEYNIKLDNDIVIQSKNWLKELIEVCEKIKNVGIVAYNFEVDLYGVTSESGIDIAEKNDGNLGGALLCIPYDTFQIIGYFCEDYGLYGEEDTDYSIRVRVAGLRTIYCANQNIGLHLPDGRAAKINEVTRETENTKENEIETDYRNWKNSERQKNLSNGIYHNNLIGYEFGLKSLYYESKFVQSYIKNSDVFIIIPFYNQIEMTVNCVESILKWTPENSYSKIILANDGSTENTDKLEELIIRHSDKIEYVSYTENRGYAYANNKAVEFIDIGMTVFENAYLLFLNNDTIVTQNWLQNMVEVIKDDYRIGAVGSKLLFDNGTIQHAGVYIAKDMKYGYDIVARHLYYQMESDYTPANVSKSYKALTGACLLMRKNVFQKLGGFDESYYNGNEDIDLCFKLITSGFKLIYEPTSIVYHLESQTKEKRWLKTKENMQLLQKWENKIMPDYLITKDGKASHYNATDIIIVVWNQLAHTKATIESIYKHTENFRLIIVNNNSNVETTQYIDELNKLQEVTVIHNNQNVGYTKAVNQGLCLSHGDVVLANNDIIVSKDWLNILRSHVTANVGIISGLTNYASGLQRIPVPNFDEKELAEYTEFRRNEYKGLYVSFPRVIFFCTYITRKCLNEVGFLDEIFSPGNYEDDDFCRRAEMLGYDTRIAMDLFVYHFGSVSFKASDDYRKLLATNEAKFIQKHGGTPNDLWGAKFNELKGRLE